MYFFNFILPPVITIIPDSYEEVIYSTEKTYSYFTAMRILVHLEKELGDEALVE